MSDFPKGIARTKRPKFSNHRGRTWDQCPVILPNGNEIIGHYDTTWGERFYFETDGVWYVGRIADFDRAKAGDWTIRPDLRNANA